MNKQARSGFTLTEVIVAMLIVAVLSSVAIPMYLGAKQKAYVQIAQADAMNLSNEVAQVLSGYTSLGSTAGTITVAVAKVGTTSTATVDFALGTGATNPPALVLQLSDQTAAYGSTKASSRSWCLDVVNRGQHVVYTEIGWQRTAKSCTTTGLPSTTLVSGGGLSAS